MLNIKEISFENGIKGNESMGKADIEYIGGASLTLTTEFYINFPRPKFAIGGTKFFFFFFIFFFFPSSALWSSRENCFINRKCKGKKKFFSINFFFLQVVLYAPPLSSHPLGLCFTSQPQTQFQVNLLLGNQGYDISKFSKVGKFFFFFFGDFFFFLQVTDFIVSSLRKVLWKNVVSPNRIEVLPPIPGR